MAVESATLHGLHRKESLLDQLELMRLVDAQAFVALRDRLSEWLRDK
jgi:hypothetical protein